MRMLYLFVCFGGGINHIKAWIGVLVNMIDCA